MKKTILLVLCIMMLMSCNKNLNLYVDAPTRFIVKDVYGHDGLNVMCIYCVEIIDPNGLARDGNGGNINFEFTDSIGKYKTGDIVNFKNKNIQ
jgi:hypothetical protein